MTHDVKIRPQTILLWLAILSVAILTACAPTDSQDDPEETPLPNATIEFSGDLSAVTDTTIVINSLTVLTVGAEIEADLVVGNTVYVVGILLEDGQIQALEIGDVNDNDDDDGDDDQSPEMTPEATPEVTPEVIPDVTPEMTPEATADPDEGDGNIIIIEGPVQAININVIVIYGIEIEVDEDDLALTVLQIGDVIRIEGRYDDDDDDDDDDDTNSIRFISVNITFVSVTVVIIDGQVWRDAGSCAGIPDWIPEDELQVVLIRCQGGGNSGNTGGGRNNGGGDNDDDDDDD